MIIKGFLRQISCETLALTIFLKNRRFLAINEGKNENSMGFSKVFNKEKTAFELRRKSYRVGRARFSMEMLKSPGKAKNLVFNMNNLIILMNFGVFMSILDYVNILKSNEEKKDEKFNGNEKINDKFNDENHNKIHENIDENSKKPLIISVILRNFLACVESSNSENIFSAKSTINLRYSSNETSDLHNEFHKKNALFSFQKPDKSTKLSISLSKLELFICSKHDIFAEKPEDYDIWKLEIKKRAILQPLLLEYFSEDFLCNCSGISWKISRNSKLSLGNTRANLSYKDLLLMYETGVFQQESLKKRDEEGFEKDNSSSEEEEADMKREVEENEDISINSEEKIHLPQKTNEKGIIGEEKQASFVICSEKIEIVSFFSMIKKKAF